MLYYGLHKHIKKQIWLLINAFGIIVMVTDIVSDKIIGARSSGKQYLGEIKGLVPKRFFTEPNIGPVNNYVIMS